jgi:hypothetical protein
VGTRVSAQGLDPFLDPPITHSWMVSLQRTLGSSLFLEADYAGTHSDKLYILTEVNRFTGDLVKNNGTLTRLNAFFGGVNYGRSNGIADSHYGSFMVSKRYNRGLSLRGIFTFGKATDYNSSFCTNAFSGCGYVLDAQNVASQKGRADFSVARRLTLDSVFEIPFPWKEGLKSKVFGGWRFSTVAIFQSGLPFSVYTAAPFPNGDFNADGFNWDFPNTPSFGNHVEAARSNFLNGLFQASDFPLPSVGQQGNLGRNTFDGPGLANVNVNFAKATRVPWFSSEGASLEFRAEIFNLFNRVNLGQPVGDLSNGLFGRSVSQDLPRAAQFGLHLSF